MFYFQPGIEFCILFFGVIIVLIGIALCKSDIGRAGCLIGIVLFIGLLAYACNDIDRQEQEEAEGQARYKRYSEKRDSIWRAYSNTLPENHRECQEYLAAGKDSLARAERDLALKLARVEYEYARYSSKAH